MLRKFGNSFFRIQHAQIRLNDISEHFYQKMHSHVAFCVIYTRLISSRGGKCNSWGVTPHAHMLHGSEGKIYFALTRPSRDKIAIIPSCDRCGCCSDVRLICRLHCAYTHKRAHVIKQYFSLLFCKVRKSE